MTANAVTHQTLVCVCVCVCVFVCVRVAASARMCMGRADEGEEQASKTTNRTFKCSSWHNRCVFVSISNYR